MPDQQTVTVLTRVVVDAHDPGVLGARRSSSAPSTRRPRRARSRSSTAGRSSPTVRAGGVWSPRPSPGESCSSTRSSASSMPASSSSAPAAAGSPSSRIAAGHQRGVEAVIDKDLASALLAERPGASRRCPRHRRGRSLRGLRHARAAADRPRHAGGTASRTISPPARWDRRSRRCAASSSAPAARAAIGSLNEIDDLLSGRAGTQVLPDGPDLTIRRKEGPGCPSSLNVQSLSASSPRWERCARSSCTDPASSTRG